ncbi:hypothetical protein [Nonomuraea sp. NPDC049646]|uniref:hypothetical protein n=1 Tax=unclassified Nonomuraea TaxID=2593643 RepID=UPI0037AE6E88
MAFDPRFTVDRIGHDTAALARLSNDLPWQANRREAAILLLERLSGEELSDDLIWGDDEPIGYYLIDQPPPPLNESELSSFLGTM